MADPDTDTGDISHKIHSYFSSFPKRTYPKGQIIVFADESPEHIFYIASGRVRKYDVSYRGDEVIVNIFKPPAFFPMSWAINKSANAFFYKTEVPTELHIVPAEAALTFLKDNPDVMLDLLSRLYRGMDGMLGRMVHLMSGSARSRLLYELIIECRRFGQEQPDKTIKLGINEVDLASRTGLSRETVSREITKLKDKHLIKLVSKAIYVEDVELLTAAIASAI